MGMPSGAPPGGASALSSVFTLLNSAVGAGVLSLPFAFRAAGWAGCLLATLAVAATEAFTLYVLARYAEVTGSATYSDLVRKMLGRKASLAMSVVLIIYSYGSATAYLIILGDCFQPMLALAFGQMWWTERGLVVFAMATIFMLPLCFFRTLDAISGFSSVTFYALCAVVGMVVHRSVQAVQAPGYHWGDVHAFRPPLDMLDALPILAFGFQCHTNLVAVFAELEEEPDLFGSTTNLASMVAGGGSGASNANGEEVAAAAHHCEDSSSAAETAAVTPAPAPAAEQRVMLLHNPRRRFVRPVRRTPKLLGMVQVVSTAICLTAGFYSAVGVFGYLNFPTNAHSNILLNYSGDDRLMLVARVLVGVIQIIHYPVNHFPARNATRDLLTQLTGCQLAGTAFNVTEVLGFFAATLGLSLLVSDLGQVFKLIGGSCGAFFIFGMPGAFCLQYAYSKHLTVREGLQQPLLGTEEVAEVGASHQRQCQQPSDEQQAALAAAPALLPRSTEQQYHFLASKLWWAGGALLLFALGLLALTVYTLLAPPV